MVSSYHKEFGNEITYVREWVQTTLMPGIKPELSVTAHPQVKNVTYQVLTPRQIKVICSVIITIDEVRLEQETGPIRLRRKHQTRPDIIPRAISEMEVVTIIPVPEQQLPVKRINTFEVDCYNPTNTVMKNRVITKSQLQFRIKYTAFATRETISSPARSCQTPLRATPHYAKPTGQ